MAESVAKSFGPALIVLLGWFLCYLILAFPSRWFSMIPHLVSRAGEQGLGVCPGPILKESGGFVFCSAAAEQMTNEMVVKTL